ncbi:PQQ-binding-like beta-propeller repeat protein, partial [bacterium]|nr:PQQ-binding-like beta-propeller repeat protein [bacterium]
LDDPTMGRVVAIDATGTGVVTDTHEKWRINELAVGFPSPAYKDGKLWMIDNSANLYQIDAATGDIQWETEVGTVGKASPVWADGKLYVTETNGRIHILRPGEDDVEVLSSHEVTIPDGDRYAEIYGSPAIADGRIFISSEGYLYALGKKGGRAKKSDGERFETALPAAPKGSPVAWVQVRPADVVVKPGEKIEFEVWTFDAMGRTHGKAKKVEEWALKGLNGKANKKGVVTFEADGPQAGAVTATVGGVTGTARVRVIPDLPWDETFGSMKAGDVPPTWIGAKVKYVVQDKDGEMVLTKLFRDKGLLRNATYLGNSTMNNYTIEADLMGNNRKRRKADIGLINGGYTIDLLGNHQRLQVRSWTSENRMMQQVDFPWEMGVWYHMKARVDSDDDKAVIRAKVWKKGESEPSDWTITVEDPLPIASGSPGLIGYSPADIYYDNVKVTVNK